MTTQASRQHEEPAPVEAVDVIATRQQDGETFLIQGQASDVASWEQILTKRAARSLWFDLTRLLYPERSDQVLAQVTTMPSMPRFSEEPSAVTAWVFVTEAPGGGCIVSGWNGYPGWAIRLNAYEVYRFWASLDVALFPTGW